MPPPLLPKRSKLETEKAQSNKITPREEQQSEKIGKSNHAASSSSSSTQGAVKRRSVFEDVTNASHSQCVQSKEDNIELKSHVSKRTKKGVGEVTQKKIKSSKMGHVTSLSNMEKEFILDIPNKPKTLTTEEPSVFQKTLVLNEEPATKETCLMRKTLKSCAFHQETLLMEKPLTLLVETEDYNEFDTELMTSKKKDKPEDPTIIEEMTDLKKSVIRKVTLTSSPLWLKNKHVVQEEKPVIQEKSSFKKISLVSNVVTTKEKPPVKKPHFRKKKPTTEMKSLLQEPSLEEKYNTQEDASILKKPQVLQENTNNKDATLTEPVTFKGKHSANEATHTKKPSSSKNNPDPQGKGTNLRPLRVHPVTYENEPMSSKKSTTKKKDSHFHGPSVLPDKHSPQMEVSTVKKSLALPNPTTEEKMLHFPVATVLEKQHNMGEAPCLKKPSPLRKQQQLPKRRRFFSNSAVQETVIRKPLFFKMSTTEKDPPSQWPSALPKKHISPGELSKQKKQHVSPKHNMEEDSQCWLDSAFKKQLSREEPASTHTPLKLEMQQAITKETGFHLRNPLVLPTVTSEAKSLTKEPPSFREQNTSLLKRKSTTHTITLQQAQSEWQEMTDEDRNLFSIKPGSHRKEPIPEFLQNPLPPNENCLISQKLSHSMPFASQKTTSQERAHRKESVASNDDKNFFSQDLFSPFSSADEDTLKFHKSLDFQEQVDRKNDSHKKMFDSQDSVSEEESFLRKLFCKDRCSSTEELSQERTVALEQEFLLIKILNENTSSDVDEPLSHQSPHIQNHSDTTKEALEASEALEAPEALETLEALVASEDLEEPLNILEELSTENMVALMKMLVTEDESTKDSFSGNYTAAREAHAEKSLSLEETSINEAATLKESLSSQEKHRAELVTVLKELLVLMKNPSLKRVALAFQENPSNNVETLLREVLALVENSTADESTLQEKPSTKTDVTPKELLALEENSSNKKANPMDSLSFDHKPDTEMGEIARMVLTDEEYNIDTLYERVLALSQGLIAADQLSFTDLQNFEETKIVDEEEFFKSFLVFENKNSPNMSSNAFESRTDNSSAIMPSSKAFNPVENSNPYVSSSKSFKSTLGAKETEITIQDDSDSLERIEKEGQDPLLNTIYAKDVFNYLKEREEKFLVQKYMDGQMELTSDMRAILVDWLVEIQGSFQMTHETLYLAVKIMDLYLMKAQCKKNHLQLLGSTTYMIAAKFEESYPPSLSEFLFICEDMYEKSDMVSLESSILQTLNFDINIPTAYNFLRRYASCIHASMKTLTLSRFICEMTLQEYEYIEERPSKLAAASFILALYMRNLSNCVPTLEYFTGYKMAELHILVRKLNHLLNFRSHSILKNVFEKYSEETYFEVAKIPPLSKQDLENLLNCALFH